MPVHRDYESPQPRGYRYHFRNHVPVDEIRRLWQRAVAECEQRFGSYHVRRYTSHTLHADEHVLTIAARTEVGQTLNVIFQSAIPPHWLRSVAPLRSHRAAA